MAANADLEMQDRKAQLLDQELDKFINGLNASNYHSKTYTRMGL